MNNIKLNKGEIICPDCKGEGYFSNEKLLAANFIDKESTIPFPKKYGCIKCKGEGKLDWIENLTGKKDKMFLPEAEVKNAMDYVRRSLEHLVNQSLEYNEDCIKSNIANCLEHIKNRNIIDQYNISTRIDDFDNIINVDIKCKNAINHIAFKIST